MLIIHANRKGITNFDNAFVLFLDGNKIKVIMSDNISATIAKYGTDERAKDVFVDILNGITQRQIDVMPLPTE